MSVINSDFIFLPLFFVRVPMQKPFIGSAEVPRKPSYNVNALVFDLSIRKYSSFNSNNLSYFLLTILIRKNANVI